MRLPAVQPATGILRSCNGFHVRGVYAPRNTAKVINSQSFGNGFDHQLVRCAVGVAETLLPVALDVNVAKPRPALSRAASINVSPKPIAPVRAVPLADLNNGDIPVLGPAGVVSSAPASGQMLTGASFKRAYSGIKGHYFMVASNAAQTAFLAKWVR